MKSTILLTTALFLASAPSPGAKTISDLSAGFLSVENDYGLMASENSQSGRFDPRTPVQLESLAVTSSYKPIAQNGDLVERHITASPEYLQVN